MSWPILGYLIQLQPASTINYSDCTLVRLVQNDGSPTSRLFATDRYKANRIAKSLVCFQAMWVLVQTVECLSIPRLSSLLKLRTAIPSQYSLTVYSGWCRKLLEIEQPFTLDMAGDPEKMKFTMRKKRDGSLTNGLHIPDL